MKGHSFICPNDKMNDNIEATQFDSLSEVKLGQIRFSLDFDQEKRKVSVTVHECKDLPPEPEDGEEPDAYVEVRLKPASKKSYKTKIGKKNHNPKYEQTFNFKKIKYNNFKMSDLTFSVFHDDFGKDDLLGKAVVSFKDLDLSKGKITQSCLVTLYLNLHHKMIPKYGTAVWKYC